MTKYIPILQKLIKKGVDVIRYLSIKNLIVFLK